jgi:polysaccharide biosynthesis protein PslJ
LGNTGDSRVIDRLQTILFGGDRRTAWIALGLICVGAGIVAGAYVAVLTPLLSLAAAAALTVGLLMLRSTQWGFFALVSVACLLPFAALPVQIGFTPTFLDLVLLVLFFVWVMSFLSPHRTELVVTPVGGFVLLFMALACAAFVAGLSHSRPTSYVIRHFAEILLAIGLFFVIVNTVKTTERLRQLVAVTTLVGAAQAGIAIFLYIIPTNWSIRLLSALGRFHYPTGAGVLRYIEDDPEQAMRAIGTSVDPNVLGGLMVLIGGLLAPQLFARRPIFKRWIVAGMLGLIGICLYLTYSRAAMLGLVAGIAFLAIVRYRKWLLIMLLAAALLAFLPQTQEYVVRLVEGLQGQDRATQMRFGEYKDAFILISRYPWLGVGFAGTPDIDTYLGVSSAYLLMAEQMGLVGVAAFLLIMIRHYAWALGAWRRIRARADDLEPLLLGALAGLGGALVAGVLDHYFFNFDFPHSVTLFWFFVGIGAAGAQIARSREASTENV